MSEVVTLEAVQRAGAKFQAMGAAMYEHGGVPGIVLVDPDGTRYPHFAGHAELIDLPVEREISEGWVIQSGLGGKGWFVPVPVGNPGEGDA